MSAPGTATEPAQGGGLKKGLPLGILVVVIALLPLLGKGGILAAIILACAVLGAPLFVIIGLATVLCFFLWAGFTEVSQLTVLVERVRSLGDTAALLAIPMFIMSGAVMSRGQISSRLIEFARALVGWIPGGLAISAVVACMLFAAISGSSPATVVAIGAMMGPSLIKAGYDEKFSHGLLTSAGSLGILIPPSIPMIVYPIVNQGAFIQVERLFAAGFGPGLVMGAILIGSCMYRGTIDRAPRDPFSFRHLAVSARDGFWSLMFPVIILGGIYSGVMTAVEAAAISVVYAVVVEVYLHRAIKLSDIPTIFFETSIFLGSLLVIMVAALALTEFLEGQRIPEMMVEWIRAMDLSHWQFLVALNLLLLVVGMMMDILSAIFVFVPLLAPLAAAMGIDPIHFGIIFIVNLEIGYLTPPVGLNLFVASTLFDKPIGHMIKSVAPFIVLMLGGLAIITYVPALSVGLGNWIMGTESETPAVIAPNEEPETQPEEGTQPEEAPGGGKVQSLQEMMKQLDEGSPQDTGGGDEGSDAKPSGGGDTKPAGKGRMQTMEEMMKEAGVK